MSYSDIKDYKINLVQKLNNLPASKISVQPNIPPKTTCRFP